MRLTDIPDLLADPAALLPGASLGVCFFGYFLCTSKESNSRVARNAFDLPDALREKPPIRLRHLPPQAGEGFFLKDARLLKNPAKTSRKCRDYFLLRRTIRPDPKYRHLRLRM